MAKIKDRFVRTLIFQCLGTVIFTYGASCAITENRGDIAKPANGLLVAFSLLAGMILCAEITDGHLNPLLSVAAHIQQPTNLSRTYILGQFTGGVLGVLLFWLITGEVMIPVIEGSEGVQSAQEILKYALNELLGSILFALLALATTNHLISCAVKSWQMYLVVIICFFLVRKMTGETVLNPAIAVPAQLLSAIVHPMNANALKSLLAIVPALAGGAIAGVIMKYFYEPMLLYKNFNQQLQIEQHEQRAQMHERESQQEQESMHKANE